jgi:hypothetical protein
MGPDERTPASTASGYYQMLDSTWKEAAGLAGIDTTNLPHAMNASFEQQHAAASALFDKYGEQPWAASAPKGATLAPPPGGGGGGTPPVLVATSNSSLGAPAPSQDLAVRYERAALALSGSMDPRDQRQAAMFQQQAQFYRQAGAWGDPVEIHPGVFAQRNSFTGQVNIQGRPTPTAVINGNLVRTSDGSIVAASNGYHATDRVSPDGRSQMIIAPDGKPEWIQMPQISPETQQQTDYNDLLSLSDKMKAGNANQDERNRYAIAYTRLGAPEWKDVQGVLTQIPSTKLPPGIYQPPGAAQPAVPPGAQPAPAPGASPAPAPTPTSYGQNVELLKGQQANSAADVSKAADELHKSTDEMNSTRGDIQLIRSNLPSVATGWGTTNVTLPVSEVISRLGYTPDEVHNITGVNPVSGELTAKNLFDLFARRVQEQGGVRAQSIFKMFERALPSLESRPETIDTLTRVYDAALAYDQKYAQDKYTFLNNQRMKFLASGNPTDYQGVGTFDTDWSKANDMRVWMGAAQAAGQLPYETWKTSLTKPQQKQAADIVRNLWPGAQIYTQDGKMNPPP